MYLLLAPSDITYLTGVAVHEAGEILILIQSTKYKVQNKRISLRHSSQAKREVESRGEQAISCNRDGFHLADSLHSSLAGMTKKGIILCDSRTSGLFDAARFEIIATREGWREKLGKYKKLFTDPDFLTQTLREKIEGYGPQLVMRKSPIKALRMIKTPEEIVKLRESQRINRAVYEAIQPFLQLGVTEEAIARRIQILQLELGASGPSFAPIVAFGENTAVPHHSPTLRKLQPDDIILIDMGVIYQGYCSDMTRCLLPK